MTFQLISKEQLISLEPYKAFLTETAQLENILTLFEKNKNLSIICAIFLQCGAGKNIDQILQFSASQKKHVHWHEFSQYTFFL